MKCPKCGGEVNKNGYEKSSGRQRYKCKSCGHETVNPLTNPDVVQTTKTMGINEAELRKQHDLNYIISTTLASLKEGVYYKKAEITNLCKLKPGVPGFSDTLMDTKYEKYRGRASGSLTYWSHPDSIQKLKDEGILQ